MVKPSHVMFFDAVASHVMFFDAVASQVMFVDAVASQVMFFDLKLCPILLLRHGRTHTHTPHADIQHCGWHSPGTALVAC